MDFKLLQKYGYTRGDLTAVLTLFNFLLMVISFHDDSKDRSGMIQNKSHKIYLK